MKVSYRYNDDHIELFEFKNCKNDLEFNKEDLLLRSHYDGKIYKIFILKIFIVKIENEFNSIEESIKHYIENGIKNKNKNISRRG